MGVGVGVYVNLTASGCGCLHVSCLHACPAGEQDAHWIWIALRFGTHGEGWNYPGLVIFPDAPRCLAVYLTLVHCFMWGPTHTHGTGCASCDWLSAGVTFSAWVALF